MDRSEYYKSLGLTNIRGRLADKIMGMPMKNMTPDCRRHIEWKCKRYAMCGDVIWEAVVQYVKSLSDQEVRDELNMHILGGE